MSTAWIWTIWTVLMLVLSVITVVNDLGVYEFPIFMIAGLIISGAVVWYERSHVPADHRA
jgi:uncharacterized membrane protein YdcZ (DUF606 family)